MLTADLLFQVLSSNQNNNFFINLRKILKILFISKALNFFCLFIMFKILFLIICKSDFTACLYSKLFMLLKFICDFFEKKLYCSISVFFYIMRMTYHLKQSLNNVVVSEQQCDSLNVSFAVVSEQ